MAELGVEGADGYRAHLEARPEEWRHLEVLCRVTISRFRRDRGVFGVLEEEVLPELAGRARQREGVLRAWSAGCASGEEPYTLVIGWRHRVEEPVAPDVRLEVEATDVDEHLLERARRARYDPSSLRELSEGDRDRAFVPVEGTEQLELRPPYRKPVRFTAGDVRRESPEGPFHLVLCRNLVFTYFDGPARDECLDRFRSVLAPEGVLVVGAHEGLPDDADDFVRWRSGVPVYRWGRR